MPYNPSQHQPISKSFGAVNFPLDARSYFYDAVNYKYRPYVSTAEVLDYLPTQFRSGFFEIVVNDGGTLLNGIITGGRNVPYWFANGIADADLVVKQTNVPEINAVIGIAPPADVIVANINIAGTYPLYGGLVVSSADLLSGFVRFFKNGSTWTKVITVVPQLSDYQKKQTSADGLFRIADILGNDAFLIDALGLVEYYKLTPLTLGYLRSAIYTYLAENTTADFKIADISGYEALWITPTGEVDAYGIGYNLTKIIQSLILAAISDLGSGSISGPNLTSYSDNNGVIEYGQSNAVGTNEQVISTTNLYPNLLSFDGVVRTSPYDKSLTGDIYPTNRRIAFVALKERQSDGTSTTMRETPVTGTLEMIALEINKFAYTTFPTLPLKFIGSAPGYEGRSLAQLSKGTDYYTRLMLDVQAGYDLSLAQGKQYKLLAVTWSQGETDYSINTTSIAYKAAMIQLKADINADTKVITGQTDDVIIVMSQVATAANAGKTYPNIALSQLDLALNTKGFYLATTLYQVGYNDGFHYNATANKLKGSYYGYTINKVISEHKEWKPIYVTGKSIQGNLAKLKFYVPVAPLKFTPANGVTLTNKGFKVMKAGVDILTSVSIGNDGVSVNLLCSASPVGALVQYGINSTTVPNAVVNLGNLQDSQGNAQTVTILGTAIKMDNWCPIFEYSL